MKPASEQLKENMFKMSSKGIINALKSIYCFLVGHNKAVPMLNETYWAIFTKGCPRCKTHLGFPETWKNCPPPPNSNKEQIKSWEEFKIKHYSKIRSSVMKDINLV